MISSVEEFIALVESDDPADRRRSAWEEAPSTVWLSLIELHPDMRFWIAHNRTVPGEILGLLVRDPDWRVRDRVASRNSTPSGILELLANDEHEAVASTVAGHPNTPIPALRGLAGHPWSQVREKAARQLAVRNPESVEAGDQALDGKNIS
jgi:hypothetical protein